MLVAIPSTIFWGLLVPLLAFKYLKKNLGLLKEENFKRSYGFLYDGYKKKKFYWEFVILYRKMSMVFIAVFLVSYKLEI